MRLIGMMDSPFVRRVAISLRLMQLPFTHEQISVFRHYDDFAKLNPVVKAPTLVTDSGTVLMESSLILDYADRLAPPALRLLPEDLEARAQALRFVGLALIACEKTVQIAYERNLRPAEKQYEPWIERVHGQLLAAYRLLEAEFGAIEGWPSGARPLQQDISVAVAWRFTQSVLAETVEARQFPRLADFSARAEASPAFLSAPIE